MGVVLSSWGLISVTTARGATREQWGLALSSWLVPIIVGEGADAVEVVSVKIKSATSLKQSSLNKLADHHGLVKLPGSGVTIDIENSTQHLYLLRM